MCVRGVLRERRGESFLFARSLRSGGIWFRHFSRVVEAREGVLWVLGTRCKRSCSWVR